MFYAQFVLSKKGPLAKIWLAAHWEKKLTKAHVFETSIEKSVEGILQPKVKLALRTSGHLLLGVVRIYSRKAKYLLADCNEAFVKIKMAFRPGIIDLPDDCRDTALTTITLPQVFHDFDTSLADLNNLDLTAHLTLNQAREDEITLKEDFSFSNFNGGGFGMEMVDMLSGGGMGGFGDDLGFPSSGLLVNGADDYLTQDDGHSVMTIDDIMRREKEGSFAHSLHMASTSNNNLLLKDTTMVDRDSMFDKAAAAMHNEDGFGASIGESGLLSEGFIGEGGLFDEAPMSVATLGDDNIGGLDDDLDDDHIGGILSHQPQTPASAGGPLSVGVEDTLSSPHPLGPMGAASPSPSMQLFHSVITSNSTTTPMGMTSNLHGNNSTNLTMGQHTFDEREVFTLEPLDATAFTGTSEKQTRPKRRRKLIVDQSKGIDGDEMRAQLADSSDLVTDLDLAPPSKKLMQWKETGGVNKLLHLPGYPQKCKTIVKIMTQQINVSSKYQDSAINHTVIEDENDASLSTIGGKRAGENNLRSAQSTDDLTGHLKRSRTDESSPEKRLDASHRSADYDYDEESHASPGGYVDEDDDYFTRDTATPSSQHPSSHHGGIVPRNGAEKSLKTSYGHDSTDGHLRRHSSIDDLHLEPLQLEPIPQSDGIHENDSNVNINATATEPEELQEEGETFENFQERVWGKRALAFFTSIQEALESSQPTQDHESPVVLTTFDTFTSYPLPGCGKASTKKMDRKTVAAKFYSLLVLKKDQVIDISQDEPYGPIYISRGAKYIRI